MPQPDIINDRYKIIERIGEGGMAVVYLAEDTNLGRRVALKMIRTGQIPPDQLPRIMERFRREGRNLARLTDVPGVVTLHDYGVHDGSPFLVMSHMPGGTLKDRLGSPMPLADAVRLLLPIIEALIYVHEMDIIHRDIKPSNLLIDRFGRLALADFGIAKAFDMGDHTLTGTGLGVGTAAYMAPEQWRGESSKQSDIYALGVVFYEMLTGVRPFDGETASDIFLKVMTQPLPDPRTFVPSLDERAVAFLQHAMQRELSNRTADIETMANEMDTLMQQTPVTAKAPAKEPITEVLSCITEAGDATWDVYETRIPAKSPPPKTALPAATIKPAPAVSITMAESKTPSHKLPNIYVSSLILGILLLSPIIMLFVVEPFIIYRDLLFILVISVEFLCAAGFLWFYQKRFPYKPKHSAKRPSLYLNSLFFGVLSCLPSIIYLLYVIVYDRGYYYWWTSTIAAYWREFHIGSLMVFLVGFVLVMRKRYR